MRYRRSLIFAGVLAFVAATAGPASASQSQSQSPATASAAARHQDHDPRLPRFDDYLALGDSLAAGVQPDSTGRSVITKQGYASDLAAELTERNKKLTFVNLACPGETTTTMRAGGCPWPHPYANQTAAATAFLAAHRHAHILVTIDIGANNVDNCAATGLDPACVGAGFKSAAADLPVILAELRAAAGPQVEFAAMNYYDPFLSAWLTGPAGQALATASVQLAVQLNALLGGVYAAFGIPVVDVAATFGTTDFTPLVALSPTLQVPLNVARICQWTWMCAPAPANAPSASTSGYLFNIHPNAVGYEHIADGFEALPLLRHEP